jgi:hypothetical protein
VYKSKRAAVDLIIEHYLCQEVGRFAPPFKREDWLEEAELSERAIFRTLRDYLTLACLGEARHGWERCSVAYLAGEPFGRCSPNREHVYNRAVKYDPIALLKMARELFRYDGWTDGYGGRSWERIAVFTLEMWQVDPFEAPASRISLYVERAINLAHNLGPVFNKPILVMENSCDFVRMVLDAFASAICTADALRRADVTYVRLPAWAAALLRRELQTVDHSVEIVIDDDYPHVEWGSERPNVDLVFKNEEEVEEDAMEEADANANAKLAPEREREVAQT